MDTITCYRARSFGNLYELEDIAESCNGKNLAYVVVDVLDIDVYALVFGILQDAEEDAQACRRDVFQVRAVDDDILSLNVVQGSHRFFGF